MTRNRNTLSLGPSIGDREAIENSRISLHTFLLEQLDGAPTDPLEAAAMEVPSNTAIEEYDWVGDIPGLVEWIGDREEATIMAGAFQIRNKRFASGIRIHRDEILDHKLAQISVRISGLAQEARYHYGELLAKLLINGFDGTPYPEVGNGLCYDGAFFFSDSHTAENGPVQSNKLTSAFSETALESAIKKFGALKNHSGTRHIRVSPTHIICGPNLEPAVDRVISPLSTIVANADDVSVSNIYRGKFQKLVTPWFSGDYHNYWVLADLSKPLKPMILQIREPITSTALTDWNSEAMYRTGEQKFGAQGRHNVGYAAWQTMVGSQVSA